ncbi:inosine-5'-monophosphate dehydrogenase domain protein [Mycobacterium kansasii]|uniref:Inosine-5'-monophosphate dehydrogenase domain protein n=1 Tax=Mycobacterium kansasii TaxID=1768 RepID=A0A1V3WKY6_MYCKA|nr:inosine-5'-monophosphate dehydrogenase domain protein [Mycobacterium kansasii]
MKDFVKTEQHPLATKDSDGRLLVGAAVGVGGDAWVRAMMLVDAGSTCWSSTLRMPTTGWCSTWSASSRPKWATGSM